MIFIYYFFFFPWEIIARSLLTPPSFSISPVLTFRAAMLGLLFFHLCSSIYMRSTLFYGPATVALFRVGFFSEEKLSYFPPFLKKSRGGSDVVVGRSRVSRRLRCPPSAPAVVLYPNPADARAYDAYGQQSRCRRREVWGGKARSSDARNAYATIYTVATLSPFLLFAVAE